MKLTVNSLLGFAMLFTSILALPAQKQPTDLGSDLGGNDLNPFVEPQLLPYNTNDCSFPTNDNDNKYKFVTTCLIECKLDRTCQTLGFNRTQVGCACPAQYCPDGKLYGFPAYTRGDPLTSDQIAKQPHVIAPCDGCIPKEVSPNNTQTGDCSKRCASTTVIYYPNKDPANSNPTLNAAESKPEEGGSPTESSKQSENVASQCFSPQKDETKQI